MKIIYGNDNGGVSVVTPVMTEKNKFKKEDGSEFTDAEWVEFIAIKDVPPGKVYEIVPDATIPTDRTFRNAWVKGVGKVEVDMPKAREIHMGRIRKARDEELKKSDIAVSKEVENGPVSKVLKDKRQALRDLPSTFDLTVATNPEELKALWPAELPK